MGKDELVKLTEAVGELGYNIETFNYIERVNEIRPEYGHAYYETERKIELTLSLPLIKNDRRP